VSETKSTAAELTPNRAMVKMLAGITLSLVLLAVLLFAGAGRLDWNLGWLFVAVWYLLKLVYVLLLRWHDPELIVERSTRHENTQPYDRWIVPVYFIFAFGTILVGGLDGGRMRWSGEIPVGVILLAYLIYLGGNFLASWSIGANRFFSSESRLQTERHQQVIQNGPYRFVRHPAYLAAVLMWPVTGILLESWWAAVPGVLAALMMVLRTIREDRMLQAELPGYREYAQQVRYRLFPGVW
jgi:protein-S-isoprenylcysteine O-methyltransferase Ste14